MHIVVRLRLHDFSKRQPARDAGVQVMFLIPPFLLNAKRFPLCVRAAGSVTHLLLERQRWRLPILCMGGGIVAGAFVALHGAFFLNSPGRPRPDAEAARGNGTGGSPTSPGVGCQPALRARECVSGFRVDQVWCESACICPCASCRPDGRCTVPADDNACDSISCPQATACRSWETVPLAAKRCKSVGVCKTPNDCGHTNTAARTSCGASGEL